MPLSPCLPKLPSKHGSSSNIYRGLTRPLNELLSCQVGYCQRVLKSFPGTNISVFYATSTHTSVSARGHRRLANRFRREALRNHPLDRAQPSFWPSFWQANAVILARTLYSIRQSNLVKGIRPNTTNKVPITVVCTSDTHNLQPTIPYGDLFVHAGDLSWHGTRDEIQETLNWINTLPHQFKVVIAGNHDKYLDSKIAKKLFLSTLDWGSIIYLKNESTTLHFKGGRCLSLYGTPYTKRKRPRCFEYGDGIDVFSNTVPEDTDVLISHSPPRFHCDSARAGDDNLLGELWRVRPKLHVFGHIHRGYGKDILIYDAFQDLYERILRQASFLSTWYLMRMAVHLFFGKLFNRDPPCSYTMAINPAALASFNDTQRRVPFVVTI